VQAEFGAEYRMAQQFSQRAALTQLGLVVVGLAFLTFGARWLAVAAACLPVAFHGYAILRWEGRCSWATLLFTPSTAFSARCAADAGYAVGARHPQSPDHRFSLAVLDSREYSGFPFDGNTAALALVVSLSVIAIGTWANVMNTQVPIVIRKFNLDPTVVSAPLITILVDATGSAIYLLITKLTLGL
jgi:hypothetical protein